MATHPQARLAERVLLPFQKFAQIEASGGIILLVCTVVALTAANSPWASAYFRLWDTTLSVGLGNWSLAKPLLSWINDGLMAIFFLVVGLEIKREVLVGELASLRRASLPLAGALGGMLVPAGIYLSLNSGHEGAPGWGIPMATDIAFALGVLMLLGNRVPSALRVFLVAVAIVDDIGAVLVIALFYTAEVSWLSLAVGGGFLAAMIASNAAGVRHPLVYAVLGTVLWLAFLRSGVHATVAGVLIAMVIPAQARINAAEFLERSRAILDEFEGAGSHDQNVLTNEEQQGALQALETAVEHVETPLQRMERTLHPWASYLILPLFSLANAGVAVGDDAVAALSHPLSLGIVIGLLIGKPLGITLAVWLAVRSHLAVLPVDTTWRHIFGAAFLGGIGFTMALFIASLAFDDALLTVAKVGILSASVLAGLVGWLLLRSSSIAQQS